MKKSYKIILSVMFVLFMQTFAISQSYDDYYYSFDEKVFLNIVNDKYVIEFPNGVDENLFTQNNIEYEKLHTGLYVVFDDITTIQGIFGQSYYINPVYQTLDGFELLPTREIILQFKDNVEESTKNYLINFFSLQEVVSTRLYDIFKVNNALQISKEIQLTGKTVYCCPNFYCKVEKFDGYIPNDEYFGQQFYLHNTGQLTNDGHYGTEDADIDAPEAWEISKGNNNIVVAVIDEGLTDNHFDLPSSRQIRLPGSNFAAPYDQTDPNDPSPVENSNHGNACSGIIAAEQDNNQGISGIAPLCKVMPIRVPFGNYPSSVYIDAIVFASDNQANIISNSWGYNSDNPNLIPGLVVAIEDAINNGSLVVFAAGNTANHNTNNNGFVTFPANSSAEGLITVAASDRDDLQANYSPTSNLIEISAPSHTAYNSQIVGEAFNVWTIDIPDQAGYNPWHETWTGGLPPVGEILPNYGTNNLAYTGRMGGTSAAAPQISGCAALALSANPNLNISQINNLLYSKADKVGGYNYNWSSLFPDHSKELGYGRLNCYKTVYTASQMYTSEVDLYIKDLEYDFGIEPEEAEVGTPMWVSPDIWVRNQPDGFENQEHENPIYSETNPVYVYVRITNKGETASYGSEVLKLYWAKASAALAWDGSFNGSGNPVMGDEISTQNIPILQTGSETILEFQWMVPDPSDYEDINPEPWHFCLLSRIVASSDPMTFPEGTSVYMNAYNNNNIAWKNVTVVDFKNDTPKQGGVIALGNIFRERTTFEIEFKVPQPCVGNSILDEAEVRLDLDDLTYQIWSAGGKQGQNILELKNKQILITGDPATLENLTYDVDEWSTLFVGFNFLTDGAASNKTEFKYLATERRSSDQMVIGGELFIIKKPGRDLFDADAGEDKTASKNENVSISAETIGEAAEYNWYNMQDSLIYTGNSFNVTLDTTTSFKLEVLATTDGFKDYDEVTVNVKQYEIVNMAPNPTTGQVTVEYDVEGISSAYLLITKPFNPATETIILDVSQTEVTFDLTDYETGIYGIILVCDDQMVDQKLLLVQ
ncbi:MAG: S8 family serine peptidase [Bacteroidales bacterium]|nr:S8 family serine peptidase [Bacteroidales bacterium]